MVFVSTGSLPWACVKHIHICVCLFIRLYWLCIHWNTICWVLTPAPSYSIYTCIYCISVTSHQIFTVCYRYILKDVCVRLYSRGQCAAWRGPVLLDWRLSPPQHRLIDNIWIIFLPHLIGMSLNSRPPKTPSVGYSYRTTTAPHIQCVHIWVCPLGLRTLKT